MIKVVIILSVVLLAAMGLVVWLFKKQIENEGEIKFYKNELERTYERVIKQNEIIQKMETGTPADQFDATVDILHQFASRD